VIVRDVSVNAADTYAWGMALGMSFDIITPGSGSVRYALVEGVPGLGIAAPGEASLSLDGVWVRGLLPSAISDGISAGSGVSAEATYLADIDIRGSRIEGAPRAGVSSFAGRITLAGTLLWCNLIDLNGEDFEGVPSEFHDAGGNGCACNADVRACKLLSSQLEPPAAPTQVEQP